MLDILISSKTRVKLLLKFFLNPEKVAYLRGLESEFGESSNGIRVELNRMEKAGLLSSVLQGNKKLFSANNRHPLFVEIRNIVLKHVGLDQLLDTVVSKLGSLEEVYLTGELANGLDAPVIDVVLVGDVDRSYLLELVEKAEKLLERKIKYVVYSKAEATGYDFSGPEYLLIWNHESENG